MKIMDVFRGNKKYGKSWGEIFFDFWDLAKGNIEKEMQRRRRNAAKKFWATILFIVGILYFLSGIASLIGQLLGNQWSGPLVIGALFLLVAMFLLKKRIQY